MKNSLKLAAVGTIFLLAATAQSRAQIAEKIYLDASLGGAIPQNVTVQNSSAYGLGGNMKLETGMRGGLTVGYDFKPSFAAEFETGVIWNSVNSIQGNTLTAFGTSADIYEISLLANIIYKPLHGAFRPYIGAGVGGAATIFSSSFSSSNIQLFGSSFNDTDWTFAYQGKAGFKYFLNNKVDLGIAYEFMATTAHNWADQGGFLKTDGTMTHSIMATFTWRF